MRAATPYQTLDGSFVTELVRPERGGSRNVSVAEAVVQPGQSTRRHVHRESDEVYFVLSGEGVVTLGAKSYAVEPGSCLFLPAGEAHSACCDGPEALKILCLCAPPYTHEQTTFCD
ncbi:MAG: cupin domain-containing protein [Armatimonadetes bacterium]|nr:cupin domain-containing protein [Armatimonadota bacterium]